MSINRNGKNGTILNLRVQKKLVISGKGLQRTAIFVTFIYLEKECSAMQIVILTSFNFSVQCASDVGL